MKKIEIRCTTCAGLGLLLFSFAALAIDGGDHLNDQETPRPKYLKEKPNDPFKLPPVEQSTEPSNSDLSKVNVDRVDFRGNTVFPVTDLEAIASPYVGRIVSVSELEELRQQLTKYYVDHGYVNSGVLISKDSANGVIVFQVVDGKLTGIRLRGMERLNDNYVTKRLAKDTDGPLNINDLRERYQLLLSDPLFQRMNARLMPDTNLGEAMLDVDVERARPYQLTATFNNYRPPSIGTQAAGLNGSVRNLSGLGDLLEASLETPASQQHSDIRGSLAWHMPIGYRGTEVYFAVDHGLSSVIEQSMQALNIQSKLDSREIGLSQTLIESLKQKLTIGLNRVSRKNTTTLLGAPYSFIQGEPDGVSNEALWRFWQEYTYRSETRVLALRSTFTSGNNNVQNVAGLPATGNPIQQNFNIWLGQAQYAHQVMDNGSQVVFRYTTQNTQDKLLPLDGISIGGVNTVRGYVENQLVRDKGQIVNLEFEYPIVHNECKVSLIPFYGIGQGQNVGEAATTISSVGLATRSQWRHFNLDLAIAKKLSYPSAIIPNGGSLQEKGVHFQLSYSY